MEQRIQYATTSDGLHIAVATSGIGPPLISVPAPPDNHVEFEWAQPEQVHGLEHISLYRTLIRFDGRGTGLSDRDVTDFSLEKRLLDLEAVVEKLALDRFAMVSGAHGNQLSVAYAARHPERVSHIIAVNPFARGKEFMSESDLELWRHILQTNYQMFTDALGAQTFGWGKEEGLRFGAFFRAAVEPGTALAIYEAMMEVDIGELLPLVKCPVLVLRTQVMGVGTESGVRDFAARLPDARSVTVPGRAVEGASDEMIVKMGEFFGEDWSAGPALPPVVARSAAAEPVFRTVLFTDIESHTTMMQRLGDRAGRDVLRTFESATRRLLEQYGGTEVKALGDGFMASFRSAQRALDCAVALQQAVSADATLPSGFRIRIGINAGEPIEEDGDLFGAAVIAAARIVPLAGGGEILVSNVVREIVAGKGHLFADRGHHALRGFDEPVRLWELKWRT